MQPGNKPLQIILPALVVSALYGFALRGAKSPHAHNPALAAMHTPKRGATPVPSDDAHVQASVRTISTSSLLVSDHGNQMIYKYALGAHPKRTAFASVPTPYGILPDRNGNLLVATGEVGRSIVRLDGKTGKELETFIPPERGGLTIPYGMVFGQDGNLYVMALDAGILRYNGLTGAFIDKFIPAGSGGNAHPSGIAFGHDGNLYLGDFENDKIYRYNGANGKFLGVFASHQGLKHTRSLTFGPDGDLYACCGFFDDNSAILRFKGADGAYSGNFVANDSLQTPSDLTFGADGKLYVVGEADHTIWSYHGVSGEQPVKIGPTEDNGAGILYRAGTVLVSGKVVREGIDAPAKAQWLTFTLRSSRMQTVKLTQLLFPDGTFTLSLPPYKGNLTIEGDNYVGRQIPLDTTAGDVSGIRVTLKTQASDFWEGLTY